MLGITVYGADWCIPCKQLKAWLANKGYKYVYRNVDEEIWETELAEITGRRILPTTVINDHVIEGPNMGAIVKALDSDNE